MAYLLLAAAIVCEIVGSSMLKMSAGFSNLIPGLGAIAGYGLSFYFLALALKDLPMGLTYALWAGIGTVLTVAIGVIFWKEHFSLQMLVGVSAIVIGVVVLNMPTGA
ncbi:DMT family transporter [Sediminibacillus albus]|uniref:Small multidrug resistance pump/multidrug resistance protein EbrA n=1 Tax=Sediminibacillus albus TaxID=407036 RepID=A0A1G9ATS3_9BACI|nr:multidrug efflux SMR transporter [Sediminibacillus albus]SDK29965.1 small multidrug resistance pump/multidrug resistance protein EbrA [Sediminibacillus albus]